MVKACSPKGTRPAGTIPRTDTHHPRRTHRGEAGGNRDLHANEGIQTRHRLAGPLVRRALQPRAGTRLRLSRRPTGRCRRRRGRPQAGEAARPARAADRYPYQADDAPTRSRLRAFAAAIKQCNRALGECRPMQQRIARAFAARTVSANSGGDEKSARAAGLACRQFRSWLPRRGVQLRPSAWPSTPPAGPGAVSAATAAPPAHPQAIATIMRWRAETTTAEASAVAKARDRLLSESEQ
jgi:hypothetical protein